MGTRPSCRRNCADVETDCGSLPGRGRWSRSSCWCDSHTWQLQIEKWRVSLQSHDGPVDLKLEKHNILLFEYGSELLRETFVFGGQVWNHLSCDSCSADPILVQHRVTTHVPWNTHIHTVHFLNVRLPSGGGGQLLFPLITLSVQRHATPIPAS